MLLRFEVANHRSIDDPVELSMIAVDEDRPAVRSFELLHESVLTVAGIYGPNASGKSNVLDALAWLASAVSRSLRAWDEVIPRDPFKFGQAPSEPTCFDIELMVNNIRYAYSLVLDEKKVLFESLFSYPERRPRRLFEREGLNIGFRRGLGGISGTRELLTPTTLALSAAMRFEEPEVRHFGRKLSEIGTLGLRPRRGRHSSMGSYGPLRFNSTEKIFVDSFENTQIGLFGNDENFDPGGPRAALALLQFADLGIGDIEVAEEPGEDDGSGIDSRPRKFVRLVHRAADQRLAFNMVDESEGTQTWFRLIGPVLRALKTGQTLLFDEIDASLHPRLSAKLLELFQDPKTNPRGGQLIFTSHDTSLLNHLNRDEIWLTEKSREGATKLTALAEYNGEKVRRSLNLEKAYLQGRFGAVPEIDQAVLKSALGLTSEEN